MPPQRLLETNEPHKKKLEMADFKYLRKVLAKAGWIQASELFSQF